MTNLDTEAADLLESAADRLVVHGHGKKALRKRTGELCVMGALRHATYGTPYPRVLAGSHPARIDPGEPAFARAVYALARRLNVCRMGIVDWNDDPRTTTDEVIDTLRHTAKDLRNDR